MDIVRDILTARVFFYCILSFSAFKIDALKCSPDKPSLAVFGTGQGNTGNEEDDSS